MPRCSASSGLGRDCVRPQRSDGSSRPLIAAQMVLWGAMLDLGSPLPTEPFPVFVVGWPQRLSRLALWIGTLDNLSGNFEFGVAISP